MTDRMIHRFQTKGKTSEKYLARNRTFAAHFLEGSMRDQGYIPVLDIGNDYKLNYIDGEVYEFVLTLQGVYIGPRAWEADGLVDGKVIWKSTPTPKSEESSKNSESE